MEEDCKICGSKIILSDTNLHVVLTEKGVNGINNAKKRRGDSSTISTGERVHIACRGRYVNSKIIEQDVNQKIQILMKDNLLLRASLKNSCLYCCQAITERHFG